MGQGEFLCGLVGSKAGGISVLKVFTPDRAGATAVRWPEDASYRSRAPSPGGPDSCGGGGLSVSRTWGLIRQVQHPLQWEISSGCSL